MERRRLERRMQIVEGLCSSDDTDKSALVLEALRRIERRDVVERRYGSVRRGRSKRRNNSDRRR
jgi:hypothetical protein